MIKNDRENERSRGASTYVVLLASVVRSFYIHTYGCQYNASHTVNRVRTTCMHRWWPIDARSRVKGSVRLTYICMHGGNGVTPSGRNWDAWSPRVPVDRLGIPSASDPIRPSSADLPPHRPEDTGTHAGTRTQQDPSIGHTTILLRRLHFISHIGFISFVGMRFLFTNNN